MKKSISYLLFGLMLVFCTGCEKQTSIVSNVDEKEANLIIVLLESRGIPTTKIKAATGMGAVGGDGAAKYDISVNATQTIEAIAILNQNGLPRKQGTTMLELFAKQGLMSSEKEETIRYQAGLAEQMTNTILMMDGVIDASVQLSFPPPQLLPGEEVKDKITASIYVKHQSSLSDPNLHLESKIKRLVSSSISGLDINDVTVVTDSSRFTEIALQESIERLSAADKEYVSIWSIVMSKESAGRFRMLFFVLISFAIVLATLFGWMLWKFYPLLKKKGGLKEILHGTPIVSGDAGEQE